MARGHCLSMSRGCLRQRCDRILKQWRALSLKAMPHMDRMTLEEFENSIGKILSAAADALQTEDPQQLRGVLEGAPAHGLERFILKVDLLDYFEEGRILRGVIILELTDALKRPMEVGEAATFHAIFDIMVQQGAMALDRLYSMYSKAPGKKADKAPGDALDKMFASLEDPKKFDAKAYGTAVKAFGDALGK